MFFNGLPRPAGVCLCILAMAMAGGCGRKQEAGPPPRYAVVSFENLSGDSSLDWVSLGASEYLTGSLRNAMTADTGSPDAFLNDETIEHSRQALGGHPAGAPGGSAARLAAIASGATRIISGYVEHTASGVRVTASEEDVTTHRTMRTVSATASTPFEALGALSRQFSAKAGSPDTRNAQAFVIYCTALMGPAREAPPLLQQALSLDPAFGRAWEALVRTSVALGDAGRAQEIIRQALARNLTPGDRALLELEDAQLRGDRSAALAAMRSLFQFSATDMDLGQRLAEAEASAGNFSSAAAVWKKLTALGPDDINAWNQLAYTLCWSGDYAGALAAAREYGRLRPREANPIDTQGDIHFWFGRYSEAAASYATAYAAAPGFLNGGDLYKGAWAKYLAGDKAGAETLYGKFREAREQAKDPSIVLFTGDWLYRTGRQKDAVAQLRTAAKSENLPAAVRAGIAAQLAVWDLLAGDRSAAARDSASVAATGMTPGDFLARFAALPAAPASEWEARIRQALAAPQLAGLRATALGYALVLDGKKEAAIPVWQEVVRQSSATDFFPRMVLARLEGQRAEHRPPPDANAVNPFAAVAEAL